MWTSTKCTVCRRKQRAPQLAMCSACDLSYLESNVAAGPAGMSTFDQLEWAAKRAYHSGRLAGLGKAHREDLKQRAQE